MSDAWPHLPPDWTGPADTLVDCVCVSPPIATEANMRQLRSLLSRDEITAADRLCHPAGQVLFCAARASLRYVVGQAMQLDPCGLVFDRTAYGKPFLRGGPQFNLSHGGDKILIALSATAPVGVDVEPQASAAAWRDVMPQLHCTEQQAILCAASPQLTFLRIWTQKEAVAKADGRGLSANFSAWSVCSQQPGRLVSTSGEPDSEWHVSDLNPGRGYVAAVAAHVGLDVRCWTLPLERVLHPSVLP